MITKLTVEKCPCGDEVCNKHGYREGTFYAGTGFPKEDAEFIATVFNSFEEIRNCLKFTKEWLDSAINCPEFNWDVEQQKAAIYESERTKELLNKLEKADAARRP